MKPRRSVVLAVLIPALLAVALAMAACGSEETTTTSPGSDYHEPGDHNDH